MPTRGRNRKANADREMPKQEEDVVNRVKTRDLQDNQKNQNAKEEGDDDADELPSRQGEQSKNDSGVSSN